VKLWPSRLPLSTTQSGLILPFRLLSSALQPIPTAHPRCHHLTRTRSPAHYHGRVSLSLTHAPTRTYSLSHACSSSLPKPPPSPHTTHPHILPRTTSRRPSRRLRTQCSARRGVPVFARLVAASLPFCYPISPGRERCARPLRFTRLQGSRLHITAARLAASPPASFPRPSSPTSTHCRCRPISAEYG
jgi:hypothetical protein